MAAEASSTDNASSLPQDFYIGIDLGTQGLSVLITTATDDLRVLAVAEGTYEFSTTPAAQQHEGHYEQQARDWQAALSQAMHQLHYSTSSLNWLSTNLSRCRGIGISGQMHGQVLLDQDGQVLAPVRLWCDARNAAEADELTTRWETKIPVRATCARFWHCVKERPQLARQVHHLTTPAGYMAFLLAGGTTTSSSTTTTTSNSPPCSSLLGIGDAAGMFPVDPHTQNYRTDLLEDWQQMVNQELELEKNDDASSSSTNKKRIPQVAELLPRIRRAGQDGGTLHLQVARDILGFQVSDNDNNNALAIPIAPGEGDQVTALAGSLVASSSPSDVVAACSLGTSVVANLVAPPQKTFQGVSPAVDHFCTADGRPLHMVWLRNGTTYLNAILQTFINAASKNTASTSSSTTTSIADLMHAVAHEADVDCGGLLALPFLDNEPGLGVPKGGTACIVGWKSSSTTTTAANVAKAGLVATLFHLKRGCLEVATRGHAPLSRVYLSGGLTKTPAMGQVVANILNVPVTLAPASEEGSSWGACVLAHYRRQQVQLQQQEQQQQQEQLEQQPQSWSDFLGRLQTAQQQQLASSPLVRFEPQPEQVPVYEAMYRKHLVLLQAEPLLQRAVSTE